MLSLLLYLLVAAVVAAVELSFFPLRPIRRSWAVLAVLAALVGIAAVLLWPPPPERETRGKRSIDSALPRYQFAERHETRVCAPADRILEAIKGVQPSEIRLIAVLSAIRGLTFHEEGKPWLEIALNSHFVLLADTGDEIVLGGGGEFWNYRPAAVNFAQVSGNPEAFATLNIGGAPKAVMGVQIRPAAFGCQFVTTETRIHVANPRMQRQFAAYWRVIQPGSALLRRTWLDAIRRRAEAR